MSRLLTEMREHARKGYIDDIGEISYAMNAISRRTLEDLRNMVSAGSGDHIRALANDMICRERCGKLPPMNQTALMDLICLLKYTEREILKEREPAEKTGLVSPSYRYLGIHCLTQWFLEAGESDYRFRVFGAAQIEQFFRCQERYSRRQGRIRWEMFQRRAADAGIDLSGDTTVRTVLIRAGEIRGMPWSPWWDSISRYQEKIVVAYEICSDLLIDSFQCMYPKYFALPNVLRRYQCGGVEEDTETES